MIIYKQESYDVVGAALQVYKTLGPGFLEAVYQEALEYELNKGEIPFEPQKELRIIYDGHELKQTYRPDFFCYGKIIVEIKAVAGLDASHHSQIYNYLRATNCKLGLLINFGHSGGMEWERIVL